MLVASLAYGEEVVSSIVKGECGKLMVEDRRVPRWMHGEFVGEMHRVNLGLDVCGCSIYTSQSNEYEPCRCSSYSSAFP